MAYDTSLLESPLRSLEEGIVDSLKSTFAGADVRAHTGEVDADSIRRLSMNRLAMLATVAMGHGCAASAAGSNLRVDVTWGIFIVACPRLVDGKQISSIFVGESYTNYVLQLAHQAKWGMGNAIAACQPGDLRFTNLGVGMKSTKDYTENEKLALFVVWGRQQIDIGVNIPSGGLPLPAFEVMDGVIQDPTIDGEPEIPILETIEQSSLVQRFAARVRRIGRPKLAIGRAANDDVYADAARRINGFAAGELRRVR